MPPRPPPICLHLPAGALVFDRHQWIRLAQLNTIVAAGCALAWLAALAWSRRNRQPREPLDVRFSLRHATGARARARAAVARLGLVRAGGLSTGLVAPVAGGRPRAGRCLGLAQRRTGRRGRRRQPCGESGMRASVAGLSVCMVGLAVMAAAIAARWDIGNWLAYRTLLVGHATMVAVLVAIAWQARRESTAGVAMGTLTSRLAGTENSLWASIARVVVLLLAVRELPDDRWWPAGALLVLAASGAALAWIFQRRRHLYDAALMLSMAGSIALIESKYLPGVLNFVYANVVLLAAPVGLWLAIEKYSISRRTPTSRIEFAPVHRVATRLGVLILAALTALLAVCRCQPAVLRRRRYLDALGRAGIGRAGRNRLPVGHRRARPRGDSLSAGAGGGRHAARRPQPVAGVAVVDRQHLRGRLCLAH